MRNSILRDFIEEQDLNKFKRGESEEDLSEKLDDSVYSKLGSIFERVRSEHDLKGDLIWIKKIKLVKFLKKLCIEKKFNY